MDNRFMAYEKGESFPQRAKKYGENSFFRAMS